MLTESQIPELTREDLAGKDLSALSDLLSLKTDHLLLVARAKLPDQIVQPLRREVKLLQETICHRKTSENQYHQQ